MMVKTQRRVYVKSIWRVKSRQVISIFNSIRMYLRKHYWRCRFQNSCPNPWKSQDLYQWRQSVEVYHCKIWCIQSPDTLILMARKNIAYAYLLRHPTPHVSNISTYVVSSCFGPLLLRPFTVCLSHFCASPWELKSCTHSVRWTGKVCGQRNLRFRISSLLIQEPDFTLASAYRTVKLKGRTVGIRRRRRSLSFSFGRFKYGRPTDSLLRQSRTGLAGRSLARLVRWLVGLARAPKLPLELTNATTLLPLSDISLEYKQKQEVSVRPICFENSQYTS